MARVFIDIYKVERSEILSILEMNYILVNESKSKLSDAFRSLSIRLEGIFQIQNGSIQIIGRTRVWWKQSRSFTQ